MVGGVKFSADNLQKRNLVSFAVKFCAMSLFFLGLVQNRSLILLNPRLAQPGKSSDSGTNQEGKTPVPEPCGR